VTDEDAGPRWSLTLYVSGASPRSAEAISTVRRICDEDIPGRFDLSVVDAATNPRLVFDDHIVAVPTLVKRTPPPLRHLVGNLTDVERVRRGLDLAPSRKGRPRPHSGEGGPPA
jgi:circadian clock protein KaiB